MNNIRYNLSILVCDSKTQWVDGVLQMPPLGKVFKKHGSYVGYIALKEELDKLKLEHSHKLWYSVTLT